MGYFTILLPNNIEGEVRWGKVIKWDKQLITFLIPWKKFNIETKRCYKVTLKSAFLEGTQYRLFQAKGGRWSQDIAGKVVLDKPVILAIRRAIEDHEKALI